MVLKSGSHVRGTRRPVSPYRKLYPGLAMYKSAPAGSGSVRTVQIKSTRVLPAEVVERVTSNLRP